MPECDAVILNTFASIGMFEISMSGVKKISWCELSAYCERTKTDLEPWEAKAVIDMSLNYCIWINKGKEDYCECPWHHHSYTFDVEMAENRIRVAAAWKLQFKKMKETA